MSDEWAIEAVARGYSISRGENPDDFVRTAPTEIRNWHLWTPSAQYAVAAIRAAGFAVVPVEQAKRYAEIVAAFREFDAMTSDNIMDHSDRLFAALYAAAREGGR